MNGPKVSPEDLAAEIVAEYYFTAADGVQGAYHKQDELTRLTGAHGELGLLTFCVLVLRNGFTVTGESACVSPENFNAETGREVARKHAVDKMWPLLGYALQDRLHSDAENAPDSAGRILHRCAKTGAFVSAEEAAARPDTTVRERR